VEISTILAPLFLHVAGHPEELPNISIKELVVIVDYTLQILHSLPHRSLILETLLDRRIEVRYGVTSSRTTYWVHSKWVVVVGVAAVVAITVIVGITTAIGTFRSGLLRLLLPIKEVIVVSPGSFPRAQAAVIGVVTPLEVLRLGRILLVVFPLHAPKTL
jgi:hypothetical protein